MDMSHRCGLCKTAWVLMVIGGLNWLLVGIGGFAGTNLNVVNLLLGKWPQVEWIVYLIVGLATVWSMFSSKCPCNKRHGEMK